LPRSRLIVSGSTSRLSTVTGASPWMRWYRLQMRLVSQSPRLTDAYALPTRRLPSSARYASVKRVISARVPVNVE
jgi:hypothetical protein